MGSQNRTWLSDWTELNWTEPLPYSMVFILSLPNIALHICFCVYVLSFSCKLHWSSSFVLETAVCLASETEPAGPLNIFKETHFSVLLCVIQGFPWRCLSWAYEKGKHCEFSAEKKSPAVCIFTKLQWNLQMHNNLLCLQNMQKHVKKETRVVYWFSEIENKLECKQRIWNNCGCFLGVPLSQNLQTN